MVLHSHSYQYPVFVLGVPWTAARFPLELINDSPTLVPFQLISFMKACQSVVLPFFFLCMCRNVV